MNDEKFINELFEAARKESATRSMDDVSQFLTTVTSGTSSSLIVKWLKQNKMNMLIATSGVIITATIFLFSQREISKESVISKIQNPKPDQVTSIVEEDERSTSDSSNAVVIELSKPDQGEDLKDEKKQEMKKETDIQPKDTMTRVALSSQKLSKQFQPLRIRETKQPIRHSWDEYTIILESAKGRGSAENFDTYLSENLSQLNYDFTSSASDEMIKKFSLKLDNRHEANFRMQVSGFEKLELHWESDSTGEIRDMWYRLDGKEIKELDFSKDQKFSIRVKHRHEEF